MFKLQAINFEIYKNFKSRDNECSKYIEDSSMTKLLPLLFGGEWVWKVERCGSLFEVEKLDKTRKNTKVMLKHIESEDETCYITYQEMLHVLETIFSGFWAYYNVGCCFIYSKTWKELNLNHYQDRESFEEEIYLSKKTYERALKEFPRFHPKWKGCSGCDQYILCDICGDCCVCKKMEYFIDREEMYCQNCSDDEGMVRCSWDYEQIKSSEE
jgi:hypothetical protein